MAISKVTTNKSTTTTEDISFHVRLDDNLKSITSIGIEFTTIYMQYINGTLDNIRVNQGDDLSLYYSNRPESLKKLVALRDALVKTCEIIMEREREGSL